MFWGDGGKEGSLRGDTVVSTISPSYLVTIMEPEVGAQAIVCARALEFQDPITVTIMLDIPDLSPDSWLYLQDRDILFGHFHEPSKWHKALVPKDRHTTGSR